MIRLNGINGWLHPREFGVKSWLRSLSEHDAERPAHRACRFSTEITPKPLLPKRVAENIEVTVIQYIEELAGRLQAPALP
jgi:hypothetical protein